MIYELEFGGNREIRKWVTDLNKDYSDLRLRLSDFEPRARTKGEQEAR